MRNAVCFTVDQNFLPMALATASVLAEEKDRNFDIVILLKGTAESRLRVPHEVQVLPNELERMIPGATHSSLQQSGVAHTRIFAPLALSTRYDRLLYLDADVGVFGPVRPVFGLDMKGLPLAAVEGMMDESAPLHNINLKDYKTNLGITDGRVFNSGVLLIDTAKWANTDHVKTMADYQRLRASVSAPRTGLYGDQDYLNYAMRGQWLGLSPRWNYQTILLRYYLEALLDPVLVHYTGSRRPWNSSTFPYGRRHIRYYSSRFPEIGYKTAIRAGDVRRFATDSLRQFVNGFGTPTMRQLFSEWKKMRAVFKSAIQRRIDAAQYADVEQGISVINLASDTLDSVTLGDVCLYRGQVRVRRSLSDSLA